MTFLNLQTALIEEEPFSCSLFSSISRKSGTSKIVKDDCFASKSAADAEINEIAGHLGWSS